MQSVKKKKKMQSVSDCGFDLGTGKKTFIEGIMRYLIKFEYRMG